MLPTVFVVFCIYIKFPLMLFTVINNILLFHSFCCYLEKHAWRQSRTHTERFTNPATLSPPSTPPAAALLTGPMVLAMSHSALLWNCVTPVHYMSHHHNTPFNCPRCKTLTSTQTLIPPQCKTLTSTQQQLLTAPLCVTHRNIRLCVAPQPDRPHRRGDHGGSEGNGRLHAQVLCQLRTPYNIFLQYY